MSDDAVSDVTVASTSSAAAPPAAEPTSLLAPAPRDWSSIPEKHRVSREDGSLDFEGTLERVDRQRSELERRLGDPGTRRPDKPADYTVTATPENEELLAALAPRLDAFREEAFERGLTGEQFDFVASRFVDAVPGLATGLQQADARAAMATLKTEWPHEQDLAEAISRSQRAVVEFGGEDAQALISRYGNDPAFIKAFERMGRTMGSDRAPSAPGGTGGDGQSAQQYQVANWIAYNDPRHPDNTRVTAEFNRRLRDQVADPDGAARQ